MIYNLEDINFSNITPKKFENLCYDLLIKYDYHDLVWRDGGADNGRDIEAYFLFNTMLRSTETKWFFECKHYTSGGVSVKDINSKLSWADAEQPDYLVFFISSYLTNNTRTWLDKIGQKKQYRITIIEGEGFKNRLLKYPELITKYFPLNKYAKLLKNIQDSQINPSFEYLKEVIENIDLTKLDIGEIVYILQNFYKQYKFFFANRNEYIQDFDESIINRVLDHLKYAVTNETLKSFEKYKNDYDELDGTGIFNEMYEQKDSEEYTLNYNFQSSFLILNYSKGQSKWEICYFLFIIYEDVAFEIFQATCATEIRIIKNFKPDKINESSLNLSDNVVEDYLKYLKNLSDQHNTCEK